MLIVIETLMACMPISLCICTWFTKLKLPNMGLLWNNETAKFCYENCERYFNSNIHCWFYNTKVIIVYVRLTRSLNKVLWEMRCIGRRTDARKTEWAYGLRLTAVLTLTTFCLYFVSIHQRATTGAQRCASLVKLLTTHLPTPEGWKAEFA